MRKIITTMDTYFCVLEISANPSKVRILNKIVGGTTYTDNTDDIDSWEKASQTMHSARSVEKFICQAGAVMNGKYIDDWTPSTSKGDYMNYTAAMQECLLGIYLSEFQNPEGEGVTGNYQLDLSDASNETFDVVNSPNAQALESLFTSAGFIFLVKSN